MGLKLGGETNTLRKNVPQSQFVQIPQILTKTEYDIYQKITPIDNSTKTGPAVFYLCMHADVAKRSTELTLSESQGFSNIWSKDKYIEHS